MSSISLDASTWREVEPYVDAALDLAPEEREGWFADLARKEPHIAQALRALFAQQDTHDTEDFLERAFLIWTDAVSADSVPGKRVGAYTLDRLLGRGGMGEVWLAARSDGLFDGRCAIKFLESALTHARLANRLRREGRLLARLVHSGIARLLDSGMTENGRQYLVLEYVDGEPIDRYCESRSLDVEARVRLFLDVVSAVAHAHANLIIHRDLKPSNVLVTRDGTVKLLDFGVAKLLSTELTDDDAAGLTRFEGVALTPEYAAPEQLLGELPSTATDVYQLGVLLYVLLAGRHPLPCSGSRSERIKAARESRLPRASAFAPEAVSKHLRGDLDAILAMALRREPSERYATAAALRDELLRYLNGEPVSARRGATLYATRKFIQRHRFAVFGSGLAMASLCAALVFAFAQARVAAIERDRALGFATRSAAVTQFLGTVIAEAAESDKPVTVADMLERAEQLALADTKGNRENRAAVLNMLAEDAQAMGDFAKAERLTASALAALGDSPNRGLRSQLICGHAYVRSTLGHLDEAIRAISHELANPPPDPSGVTSCLHDRALVATTSGDTESALRYATEALAQLRSNISHSTDTEANFLATVGSAHYLRGHIRETFDYYEQALRKLDEVGLGHGPSAVVIRKNLATVSLAAGVPRQALQLLDEIAHDIAARTAGPSPPSFLIFERARALHLLGRYEDARVAYEACLQPATEEQAYRYQVYCLCGRADMSRLQGDTDAAGQHLARAAALLGSSEPADSLPSSRVALGRAQLHLAMGQIDEARTQFTRVLNGQRNKQTTIDAALGKAETELRAGAATTAVADARRALAVATAQQGGVPHSQQTGLAQLMLGRALHEGGDEAQAREAFAAAVNHLSNTLDANHPALVQALTLNQR